MFKPGKFLVAVCVVCSSVYGNPAAAADMQFQLVNDTEYPINLRFFSQGESRQVWPSKTKAFTLKVDAAAQQVKISCNDGEKICWGGWTTTQNVSGEITGAAGQRSTVTNLTTYGAGERGQRTCEKCCEVCTAGAPIPPLKMSEQIYEAK